VLSDLSDWYFSFHRDTQAFWDHPEGRIVGDLFLAAVMFSAAHLPTTANAKSSENV
jgi:hypothetical protein